MKWMLLPTGSYLHHLGKARTWPIVAMKIEDNPESVRFLTSNGEFIHMALGMEIEMGETERTVVVNTGDM